MSPRSKEHWDSAKLEAALDQVRRRHSALRVSIVDDADSGPAFHRMENPIELRTAAVEAAADWRETVETELNRPFDTVHGPLMRATALWVSDGASIVLTFHHAIMDALSGTHVLHDVMRALAGENLEVLPPLPPVEEMIASFASNPVVVGEGGSRADLSSSTRASIAPSDRFMANLAIMQWGPEETARLLRSCEANGDPAWRNLCSRLTPPSSFRRQCCQDALSYRLGQDYAN